MRKILVLLVLTVLAVFAADVTGAWKGVAETPMGPMDTTANFKCEGSVVTGTLSLMGTDQKIEKGKLEGDKISFELPMDFGTLEYKGVVSGDEMKLKVSLGGEEGGSLSLKRAK